MMVVMQRTHIRKYFSSNEKMYLDLWARTFNQRRQQTVTQKDASTKK